MVMVSVCAEIVVLNSKTRIISQYLIIVFILIFICVFILKVYSSEIWKWCEANAKEETQRIPYFSLRESYLLLLPLNQKR